MYGPSKTSWFCFPSNIRTRGKILKKFHKGSLDTTHELIFMCLPSVFSFRPAVLFDFHIEWYSSLFENTWPHLPLNSTSLWLTAYFFYS